MITRVLTDDTNRTGVYYDEKGQPMVGSVQVHDPAFQDRVVAETRRHDVEHPANGDAPIIAQAAVGGEQQYTTEEVFAYTQASVEEHATGAGNQDGAEMASVRFLQSRAQTNEDRGHNERQYQMGCCKNPSCACLHWLRQAH